MQSLSDIPMPLNFVRVGCLPLVLAPLVTSLALLSDKATWQKTSLHFSEWQELAGGGKFFSLLWSSTFWQAAAATDLTASTRRRLLLRWSVRASHRRLNAVARLLGNGVHLKA